MEKMLNVSDVVFRKDLYPRIETSTVKVQEYAETLDQLPPIEVNQNNELIDGWHRWTAHKKQKVEKIKCVIIKTKSDSDLLELAIEKNAKHGLQLSMSDKRDMARRIYNTTAVGERDEKKKRLATILSVSERTIRDWLSRIDKDNKEQRNKRIYEMWLACYTQQEIADEVGIDQGDLSKQTASFMEIGNLAKSHKTAAEHASGFEVPIYNIWKQQTKSAGASHFGNSEVRWVDNLLYLYTDPFDVVIDPFAGSGSTAELCRKRHRRYLVSDRIVQPELEGKHIRQHDVTDGLLKPPQWKDVSLVYLDPPYWKQAEGQYSDDKSDLANMSYEAFTTALAKLINDYMAKLPTDACLALIIQPTQWKAPNRDYVDHVGDMLRRVKHPVDMRYSVPYESQQCNAQMVEWSKENYTCLVLTREIVVWRSK